ncbi:Protein CBG24136 [Caenorhabditis briggsae]|uniref:Protein CBG24136 n=1 Tax=Caenorhabditis briggsae TaxID=6238 RepID=A8WK21_CAEBR|nr:Protein CBG24136 [Caenorhabditis briggsae]CAP20814.2 Protein CBG24136 [Caenorhabditis briggsae]
MSSDGQGMSTMDVTMTEETNKIGNMIKNNEMTDSDVPKVQPKVQNFEMPAFVAPDMVFYEPISSVRIFKKPAKRGVGRPPIFDNPNPEDRKTREFELLNRMFTGKLIEDSEPSTSSATSSKRIRKPSKNVEKDSECSISSKEVLKRPGVISNDYEASKSYRKIFVSSEDFPAPFTLSERILKKPEIKMTSSNSFSTTSKDPEATERLQKAQIVNVTSSMTPEVKMTSSKFPEVKMTSSKPPKPISHNSYTFSTASEGPEATKRILKAPKVTTLPSTSFSPTPVDPEASEKIRNLIDEVVESLRPPEANNEENILETIEKVVQRLMFHDEMSDGSEDEPMDSEKEKRILETIDDVIMGEIRPEPRSEKLIRVLEGDTTNLTVQKDVVEDSEASTSSKKVPKASTSSREVQEDPTPPRRRLKSPPPPILADADDEYDSKSTNSESEGCQKDSEGTSRDDNDEEMPSQDSDPEFDEMFEKSEAQRRQNADDVRKEQTILKEDGGLERLLEEDRRRLLEASEAPEAPKVPLKSILKNPEHQNLNRPRILTFDKDIQEVRKILEVQKFGNFQNPRGDQAPKFKDRHQYRHLATNYDGDNESENKNQKISIYTESKIRKTNPESLEYEETPHGFKVQKYQKEARKHQRRKYRGYIQKYRKQDSRDPRHQEASSESDEEAMEVDDQDSEVSRHQKPVPEASKMDSEVPHHLIPKFSDPEIPEVDPEDVLDWTDVFNSKTENPPSDDDLEAPPTSPERPPETRIQESRRLQSEYMEHKKKTSEEHRQNSEQLKRLQNPIADDVVQSRWTLIAQAYRETRDEEVEMGIRSKKSKKEMRKLLSYDKEENEKWRKERQEFLAEGQKILEKMLKILRKTEFRSDEENEDKQKRCQKIRKQIKALKSSHKYYMYKLASLPKNKIPYPPKYSYWERDFHKYLDKYWENKTAGNLEEMERMKRKMERKKPEEWKKDLEATIQLSTSLKSSVSIPSHMGDPLGLWDILKEWKKEESVDKIHSPDTDSKVLEDIDESDGPPNSNKPHMMDRNEQLDPKNQKVLLQECDRSIEIRNLGIPDVPSEDLATPATQSPTGETTSSFQING